MRQRAWTFGPNPVATPSICVIFDRVCERSQFRGSARIYDRLNETDLKAHTCSSALAMFVRKSWPLTQRVAQLGHESGRGPKATFQPSIAMPGFEGKAAVQRTWS